MIDLPGNIFVLFSTTQFNDANVKINESINPMVEKNLQETTIGKDFNSI